MAELSKFSRILYINKGSTYCIDNSKGHCSTWMLWLVTWVTWQCECDV